MFIPCADPTVPRGPWTLLLDNSWVGTDLGIAGPFTYRGFRSVSVSSSPCTLDRVTNQGFYGRQEFGMYWADPTNRGGIDGRSVGIAQFESMRKWDFVDMGDPLPFEDSAPTPPAAFATGSTRSCLSARRRGRATTLR